MDLQRGQKVKLSDLTPGLDIEVGVGIGAPGMTIDVTCFGLNGDGKLADDRYFIFYNQTASPCRSLVMRGPAGVEQQTFGLSLGGLPATVRRLVFTATIDGAPTFSATQASHLRISANGAEVARFRFSGADFRDERAVMIAEVYFKDIWRVAAVGQGFNGGLAALLKHFGGEESRPAAPTANPPAPPVLPSAAVVPPPVPPRPVAPPPLPVGNPPAPVVPVAPVAPPPVAPVAPPIAPAAPPKLSLQKLTLEKRGAKTGVSLKKGGELQPIHVNLNWDDPSKKSGGLLGWLTGPAKVDLDLGCMFILTTGEAGVIQPLGGYFGARHEPPYIHLDKDDRSGAAKDGENLHIYRPDLIQKLMLFALIYEGTANFSTVHARLTIKDHAGNEILINLDTPDPSKRFCAICMFNKTPNGLEISKEEQYFLKHSEADARFGFGFRWSAGQK